MTDSGRAAKGSGQNGKPGEHVLFDIDRGALTAAVGEGNVHRLPVETAERYGFSAETSEFFTRVGIPSVESYWLSFGPPAEFSNDFFWHRAVEEAEGWKFPDGVDALVKIGNFPVNCVVIDPATGIVYQYTYASMEPIPVHGDVSSLAKTVSSFVGYVESYARGDDEDDDDVEYVRRKREVDAMRDAIRLVDPLPFAHEYSEWVEMFDNLEGGIYT